MGRLRAIITAICILIVLLNVIQPMKAADSNNIVLNLSGNQESKQNSYQQYLNKHKDIKASAQNFFIDAVTYKSASSDSDAGISNEMQGQTDVLIWNNFGGSIEWEIDIKENAVYSINLQYLALKSESRNVELGLYIDGMLPFDAAADIVLPRVYSNKGLITTDSRGNDIRPEQTPLVKWLTEPLSDKDGLYNEPYSFYFTAGKHIVRFDGIRAGIAIKSIIFYKYEPPIPYFSYSENAKKSTVTPEIDTRFIQGENPIYQSDSVLYPVYDRSGPDTIPSDPTKLKLNTIGQGNWNMDGQFIVWNVNVPQEGYYKMGIRYHQNLARNLISYRRLYINGVVPFKEAESIPFSFSDKWQTRVLGGGWLFKLNKGNNEIRLEAIPGDVGVVIANLQNAVNLMSNIYRKIIMITGVIPDPNRDYVLDSEVPGLNQTFLDIKNACQNMRSKLNTLNGVNTAASTSVLQNIIVQINSFIESPDTIAIRISNFNDNISSLSSLLLSLKNQPLEIDYISVGTNENNLFMKQSSWINRFMFSINAFTGSFFEDYSSIGNVYSEKKSVNVWVNLGRDQTQVIKTMSDSMFTPKSNISVNVSLVQQSLVLASLSNTGPDVVIFVGQTDPVNLAARGSLQDLSVYNSFNSIKTRFNPNAFIPYYYNNGCYAIPVTESFPMMFYRTDIFNELDLKPPKTWNDFLDVASVLQRNNMTAGIPNMPPDSQMSTNNTIFAMLMKQSGADYYKNDLSATNFDSAQGVQAFKDWTGFYSSYGLPYQYDFYNRFRTGEMPIGIENYTLFNKFQVGAPEIKGLWKMIPIPGKLDENEKINNMSCAGGSSIIMLNNAKNKDAAWEFIDWFTSTDAQSSFGLEMESLLGASGRYDTANIQAFYKLPWSAKEQTTIKEQWDNIFELPQVPGGYYTDRNLTNAFRQVVFMNKNPRKVLIDYNREINNEISRKYNEFKAKK